MGISLLPIRSSLHYQAIQVQKTGPTYTVTLDRPQHRNALNMAMAEDLAEACRMITEDDDVRMVLLTGAGGIFCSGEDVEEYRQAGGTLNAWRGWPATRRAATALAALKQPVIAAIEGEAVGAGLELALCCDLRVASEGARFSMPQTTLGLIPCGGGTQRLPRLVGRGRALEMLLTGAAVDAAEALRCGLVNRVAPSGRALAVAEDAAGRILERGPIAVAYAKEAVSKGMDGPLDQGLRLEADLSIILQTTADREEGVRAFLEKRSPRFRGE